MATRLEEDFTALEVDRMVATTLLPARVLAYQGELPGRLRAPVRSDSLLRFQDVIP
jgi:hypothetical protein